MAKLYSWAGDFVIRKTDKELQEAWGEYHEWLKNRPHKSWEGMRFDVDGPDAVRADIIETFPYWYRGSHAVITIDTDEFISVCPWSGLPDFAKITIDYVPGDKCIELKSLKYYFYTWRNVGMFYEHIINKILQDLVDAAQPRWMRISGVFNVRGGLGTRAEVEYGTRP